MIKLRALLAGTTFHSWKIMVKVQSPKFHPQLAHSWFFLIITSQKVFEIPNFKFPRPKIKSSIQYTYKKNRLEK